MFSQRGLSYNALPSSWYVVCINPALVVPAGRPYSCPSFSQIPVFYVPYVLICNIRFLSHACSHTTSVVELRACSIYRLLLILVIDCP